MVDSASAEVVDAQVVSAIGVEASGEEASDMEMSDARRRATQRRATKRAVDIPSGGGVQRFAFPRVALRTCVSSGRRIVRATPRRRVSFTVMGRPSVRTLVGMTPNITTATRGPSKLRSWRKHLSIDGNT
eukprot:3211532-Pleurochrysis_carterae.AAC.1